MRKILIGLIALTSLSTLASEMTKKCNVYQLVSDTGYSRYEKIDTLDLGNNSSEFSLPVKGLDNIGLKKDIVEMKQNLFDYGMITKLELAQAKSDLSEQVEICK